ncbi:MAG: serine protease, partial [Symploca sp. SIO1B1]|nr:serine protease [Symploca sp. SIO1B1]
SDQVNKGDQVYVSGYFNSGGRLVDHFVPGNVTAIDQLPEGYGIAYDATTAGGMSGGPVANKTGEIIAIHGRSDIEISELAKLKGEAVSEILQATAEEESGAVGSKTSVFKWGIPTKIYQANLAQVPKVGATDLLTAEDYFNQGNDFSAQGRYQETLAAYNKAIDLQPDKDEAWFGRGFALYKLGKYQDAITSYDKAIEMKPDYALPWVFRGITLRKLGKYQEALASYDQAIEIIPDNAAAWALRSTALNRLGKYQEALASYDKAIKIEPNYADAWYGRGIVLETLKRYNEALESYEKAIQFDSNNQKTINNRKRVLEKLGR